MKKLTLFLVACFSLFLTSCNDAVEAAYGLATFFFIVIKWGLILLVAAFIIAFIISLFNRK